MMMVHVMEEAFLVLLDVVTRGRSSFKTMATATVDECSWHECVVIVR